MAHVRQKCAFGLIGGFGTLLGLLQFCFHVLAFGNITKTPYPSDYLFANNLRLGVTLKNLSIFQLNPAPFCMLDEVDAPLDDANVGRYARMVKEMSDRVQFIFITHNKITMEMADQLMGVTMHEPGVSRLVSVDVDEAAELAAS